MDLDHPTRPIRLNLDTTRRCQLNCWYCHSSSGPDYRGPAVDPAIIPDLLEAADEQRVFEITITGGEPTMWPGLVPLLEQSSQLDFTSLLLITNAMATPPRILQAIESANLSRICVSLDGIADVHDRNRGHGTYWRTINGLGKLADLHDNIAVISVIDASNHTRWPELTMLLADMGVRAHHLTPVCTAGHALGNYQGLTVKQFAEVNALVDEVAAQVGPQMSVLFNDELVHPLPSRTIGIHQFTENWKGWHRIIRPDGDVRTQIRAWGRSWRSNESLGNVNQQPLSSLLAEPVEVVPFSRQEEIARKFRINADARLISTDLRELDQVEHGQSAAESFGPAESIQVPESLGIPLEKLRQRILLNPERYRLRKENDFTLLFDTRSHEIHILTEGEYRILGDDLAGVHA